MLSLLLFICCAGVASALTVAQKKFLPARYAAAGAVALDGSPYAYYISPGVERTKFVVFQKGGAFH